MIVGLATQALPTTVEELLSPSLMAALDRLDASSRKLLMGVLPGERRSKRRGRSVEFDDFRDYSAGDDLRHIDWNIYARLDRLFIKLFREEEDLALNIAVDCSASMNAGDPGKLLYAHRLAFALSYVGLVNHNRVSIATFAPRAGQESPLSQLAPLRGRTSVRRIGLHLLKSLQESSRSLRAPASGAGVPAAAFARAMQLFSSTSARKGVCIVLSDFLSPSLVTPSTHEPGLDYLGAGTRGGATDTYCLQILAPQELDPRAAETQHAGSLRGDLRLTDVETGAGVEVTITPDAVESFRARFATSRELLREACSQRGIAYVCVNTSTPIEDLLLNTLRRGGLLS